MRKISKLHYYLKVIKSWLTGCPHIVVTILRDEEAGLWLAFNDNIGLATEASSLENLIEIVEQLVPELIEEKTIHYYKESGQALA